MQSHAPGQGDAERSGSGDSDGPMAPLEIRIHLDRDAAASARQALRRCLHGHVADPVIADAQLLVSELVSNSLRHATVGGRATLRVAAIMADGVVRLEVDDPGTAGVIALREPSLEGGWGLNLVEALAHRWGVERDGYTRVWVELVPRPVAT
jgi:anti-sigma regulatory factor (Ser/Thr protein kinase)